MKYLYIILIGLIMSCSNSKNKDCINITISDIGGCDKDGYCGVSYSDGTYGKRFYPVKNKEVCK